ncbi:MAG: ABC transporter permease subunit [Ruminococcaceae bacterium]|nr:ABC transporter permease subunit [Oscillospiraceae bacterium]
MKKLIHIFLAVLLIIANISFPAFAEESGSSDDNSIVIAVNGDFSDEESADHSIFTVNGELMISLRLIADKLEADYSYDEDSGIAVTTTESDTVTFTVGNSNFSKNGTEFSLFTCPTAVNGEVMISQHDAAFAYNIFIEYDIPNVKEDKNAVPNETKVTISGYPVKRDIYGQPVYFVGETMFLQLRCFVELNGGEYTWEKTSGTITATIEEDVYSFTVGTAKYEKNSVSQALTSPVTTLNQKPVISKDDMEKVFGVIIEYKTEKDRVTVKPDPNAVKLTDGEKNQDTTKKEEKKGNVFLTVIGAMNKGFLSTLKLFIVTLLGALPLGLLISLGSMSKFKPLKWLMRFLVWVIRGTPLMLQLLIIFYIPGMVLEGGSPWPSGESGRFMAASVAFIINYAFYFSEIFRGGIESVPNGQVEAGQVLGMTKKQIFFNVTLLQMIKRIVPPMSNEIITLVKDTSIARIISLQEVIWAGYSFLKGSHGYSGLLWPLFFTGVYYLLFNGLLTILFSKIEKKLSYFN